MKENSIEEALQVLNSCKESLEWIKTQNFSSREEIWNELTNSTWIFQYITNTFNADVVFNLLNELIEETISKEQQKEIKSFLDFNTPKDENVFIIIRNNNSISIQIKSLLLEICTLQNFYINNKTSKIQKEHYHSFNSQYKIIRKIINNDKKLVDFLKSKISWNDIDKNFQDYKNKII